MEHAPLRPVPPRPDRPVERDEAVHHVTGYLPALDATAAGALALVEVAGRPRTEAAAEVDLSPEELAEALTRARKALRRSIQPLPGSGWCERAERYISDRLDDELVPPGSERLAVHLDNCPRCVDHELRLAQATEALMRAFVESVPPAVTPAEPERAEAPPEAPAPELTVVPPQPEPVPEPPVPAAVSTRSRGVGGWLAALTWHALFALAVVLAVLAIALAVVGILGGEL